MRIVIPVFCSLFILTSLSSCAQMQEYARQQELARQQQLELQHQSDINHCTAFGYPNPSREFSDCMMTLYRERIEDARQAEERELRLHEIQRERHERRDYDRDRGKGRNDDRHRHSDRGRDGRENLPFGDTPRPGFTPPSGQPLPQRSVPSADVKCIPYIPGGNNPGNVPRCRGLGDAPG